jgi:predicted nucleic acid-binding protein
MSDDKTALVVDASVAVKWQMADEEETPAATAILWDALDGRVTLFAPALIRCEVANALCIAVRKGRLGNDEALAALDDFLQAPLSILEYDAVLRRAYVLAEQYARSVYDASYLALAEYLGIPLYTGDRRLYNAVNNSLPWVRWIGSYPPDPGREAG